jgi:hypothetical protein
MSLKGRASLLVGLVSLACATSAKAAETWTCSPNATGTSVLIRFTLSPPDVISTLWDYPLRIVHNDNDALVATGAKPIMSAEAPRLYVHTIAINKVSGEFVLATAEAGEKDPDLISHGKCLKD